MRGGRVRRRGCVGAAGAGGAGAGFFTAPGFFDDLPDGFADFPPFFFIFTVFFPFRGRTLFYPWRSWRGFSRRGRLSAPARGRSRTRAARGPRRTAARAILHDGVFSLLSRNKSGSRGARAPRHTGRNRSRLPTRAHSSSMKKLPVAGAAVPSEDRVRRVRDDRRLAAEAGIHTGIIAIAAVAMTVFRPQGVHRDPRPRGTPGTSRGRRGSCRTSPSCRRSGRGTTSGPARGGGLKFRMCGLLPLRR